MDRTRTILYELSSDKKELLVTDFWINEEKIKEWKKKLLEQESIELKLYQFETNMSVDPSKSVLLKEINEEDCRMEFEAIVKSCLTMDDYARIVEMKIDTFFEKIRQTKIIKNYLNDVCDNSCGYITTGGNENMKVYKMFTPMKVISPYIYGGEVYLIQDMLKVPVECQALDLFIKRDFCSLTKGNIYEYIPWYLFEKIGHRIENSKIFLNDNFFEEQRKMLPEVAKILKLYKSYEEKSNKDINIKVDIFYCFI